MRLSSEEQESIIQAVDAHTPEQNTKLFLYGSRVDDNRRGGDIDLVVVTSTEFEKYRLLVKRIDILVRCDEALGEQKIDLSFVTQSELVSDPFYVGALVSAICLKIW